MVTAWPREVYHFGSREHCNRQGKSWYVARCPSNGKGCVMLFSLPCAVKADVYHLKLFVLPRTSRRLTRAWSSGDPTFCTGWSATRRSNRCGLPSAVCWRPRDSSCSRTASSIYVACGRLPSGAGILCVDFQGILSEPSSLSTIAAVPIVHSVVFSTTVTDSPAQFSHLWCVV